MAKKNVDNRSQEEDMLTAQSMFEQHTESIYNEDADEDDATLSLDDEDDEDEEDDEGIDEEEELDEDDEEDEEDFDDDDEEDDEEEEPDDSRLSKAERKIMELKRQLKEERNRNKSASTAKKEQEEDEDLTASTQYYVDQGFDDDQARRFAERDARTAKAEKRLAILEFKDVNADTLKRYPVTRDDLERIMKAVDSSGMTVDQVCRGLYGGKQTRDQRARAAVTGDLPKKTKTDTAGKATRASSRTDKGVILTAKDRRQKRMIEQNLLDGEKIPDARWAEYKKQYNL